MPTLISLVDGIGLVFCCRLNFVITIVYNHLIVKYSASHKHAHFAQWFVGIPMTYHLNFTKTHRKLSKMRKTLQKHSSSLKLIFKKSSIFLSHQIFTKIENEGYKHYNSSWHRPSITTSSRNKVNVSRSFYVTACDLIHFDNKNLFTGHLMTTSQVTNIKRLAEQAWWAILLKKCQPMDADHEAIALDHPSQSQQVDESINTQMVYCINLNYEILIICFIFTLCNFNVTL